MSEVNSNASNSTNYDYACIAENAEYIQNETKLHMSYDVLEKKLKDRTDCYNNINETLIVEIDRRKRVEKKLQDSAIVLKSRSRELEDINTALKVLLKQRERDRHEIEMNILSNIKLLINPYIRRLKMNRNMSDELIYLNIIEDNLNEISSSFSSSLSFQYSAFTPKEVLIADLIRDGLQDKDITNALNISLETVKSHRQNMRKKLDIYGTKSNLREKLLSLLE